jgi:hypothetical protein
VKVPSADRDIVVIAVSVVAVVAVVGSLNFVRPSLVDPSAFVVSRDSISGEWDRIGISASINGELFGLLLSASTGRC